MKKDESFEDAVGMKILRVNSVTLKFILKCGLTDLSTDLLILKADS